MVHTLYRVKSVGCMPLESLKIWLTEDEYRRCANSPYIERTWYKLTTDVFIALLFRINLLPYYYFHLISMHLDLPFFKHPN
jgi:hypothetical protein